MLFNLFLLFEIFNRFFIDAKLTEIVQTDKGPVQGRILQTIRWSVEFSSFQGIRYGKPPLGYRRFKAPEAAESWSEIFQATSEPLPCPQKKISDPIPIGSEDCLHLNVYTPKTNFSNSNDTDLLPVIMWIHGGALYCGSMNQTNFGPDFFIENGVVVVAINYRLGILGFLALNLPNVTGNAGLKDQVLALKWIQRNIRVFGGNPESVTILGISAGGLSVDYHVLSDVSQGLFHRSISMSGFPMCPWGFFTSSKAEAQAFRLGRKLGIFTKDKEALLAALYLMPAQDLAAATASMGRILIPFAPVIEDKKIAKNEAFLTKCFIDIYQSGNFSQVPHLMGFMANETLVYFEASDMPAKIGNFLAQFVDKIKLFVDVTDILSKFPFLSKSRDEIFNNDDSINRFIDDSSDLMFISGIDSTRQMLTKYGSAPVYYYKNSFAGNASMHKVQRGIEKIGASHADDVGYLWRVHFSGIPNDPDDPFVITRDRMLKMWTNFAKYSDPTPSGSCDPLLNITWPESGPSGTHLEINTELSIVRSRPISADVKIFQRIVDATASHIYQCSNSGTSARVHITWIFFVHGFTIFYVSLPTIIE